MKTEMMFSVKYVICGRMKKESSNVKLKGRHLNQKTNRSRWVIRFCVGDKVFSLKRILLYNKLKNTC